jgi:predicted nucleic acid-binding Zn ribbon protein
MCRAFSDSESERAAVAARGGAVVASSRPCPVCGQPMTGRKTSACSDKCRAAKSRRRRVALPVAEAQAIRASLTTALEAVWEARSALGRYGG